eukprot:11566389-Ditylum_brightwellii.AAC.1
MEYQHHGIESLLYKDLIQWTKACTHLWSSGNVRLKFLRLLCPQRHAKRAKLNTSRAKADK